MKLTLNVGLSNDGICVIATGVDASIVTGSGIPSRFNLIHVVPVTIIDPELVVRGRMAPPATSVIWKVVGFMTALIKY